MAKHGDLKVWHIPQVPGQAFEAEVSSLREAKLLLDVLAKYDAFQFEHNIKPDYCNVSGLVQFDANDNNDSPDGSWVEWHSEDGYSIDEVDDDGNLIED